MSEYIRLTEAPQWCISYPTCSACAIDLDCDADGWVCPSCGTSWGSGASDGDTGELYADWAGEEPTGPEVSHADAAHWGAYVEARDLHERFGERMPTLFPKPTLPTFAKEQA